MLQSVRVWLMRQCTRAVAMQNVWSAVYHALCSFWIPKPTIHVHDIQCNNNCGHLFSWHWKAAVGDCMTSYIYVSLVAVLLICTLYIVIQAGTCTCMCTCIYMYIEEYTPIRFPRVYVCISVCIIVLPFHTLDWREITCVAMSRGQCCVCAPPTRHCWLVRGVSYHDSISRGDHEGKSLLDYKLFDVWL